MSYGQRDDLMAYARRQFWTKPGSAKDVLLQRMLEESLQEREGHWALAWDPVRIGVVTWEPR
jgi:hypothetical protein